MAEQPKEPIFLDDGKAAYHPSHGIITVLQDAPAVKPTTPTEMSIVASDYLPWGDDNNFPNLIEEKAHANDLIPSVLNFKANHMAAAGLFYGIITGYDGNNKPIIKRVEIDEVEEFWEVNNRQLYLEDTLRNLYWYHHAFVDLYLNDAKTRIVHISTHDTTDCRYSQQNPTTGNKDFVYISGYWPDANKDKWKKVRCIDPYYNVLGQLGKYSDKRFIYPLFFNSPRRKYYQRTPWHSLIDSYWLDLANKIPRFKAKLMDNQMVLAYAIQIPHDYWPWRFSDWGKKNDAEKKAAVKDTITEFNNSLTGVEKAGKTIAMTFKADAYGKGFTKWEIQQFKGNLGEGAYIEDSQEASDHILFSLAFDGTLIGKTPGKGMGAGSGSDKRLADEIFFKNNKPYILKTIEPLNLIARVNNWQAEDKRIYWFQEQQILTTLNNVKPDNRPDGNNQ